MIDKNASLERKKAAGGIDDPDASFDIASCRCPLAENSHQSTYNNIIIDQPVRQNSEPKSITRARSYNQSVAGRDLGGDWHNDLVVCAAEYPSVLITVK